MGMSSKAILVCILLTGIIGTENIAFGEENIYVNPGLFKVSFPISTDSRHRDVTPEMRNKIQIIGEGVARTTVSSAETIMMGQGKIVLLDLTNEHPGSLNQNTVIASVNTSDVIRIGRSISGATVDTVANLDVQPVYVLSQIDEEFVGNPTMAFVSYPLKHSTNAGW